jgi:hypothetical protein
MRFVRLSAIKATADVVSGILNWVCPECEEESAAAGKSSAVRISPFLLAMGRHF